MSSAASLDALMALQPRVVALLAELGAELSAADRTEVTAKGNDGLDFVTSLDLSLQAKLEATLPALLPGSEVSGEEGFVARDGIDEFLWLVDPLDGTVNFVAGLPVYAIAVVLLHRGLPVLAAVHDAPRGLCYSAVRGGGAWRDGAPLVRRSSPTRLCAMSSGLIRDFALHAPAALDGLMSGWKLRNLGSQALQLCHAAEGHLGFVASREARAWDDLAGALIATEAGLTYGRYAPGPAPAADQPQSSLCAAQRNFATLAASLALSLSGDNPTGDLP